ncbi:unnamed protein product [Brachionus calyciflorus]|uniref:Chitin-binding type-2 domain-containing protein n=1 Tax=Brachionus calyciflorus TaxID=104777 RepID=A0A814J6Q3_9BILA|nr:unnamed protein product [Brachionus calyciflorus]
MLKLIAFLVVVMIGVQASDVYEYQEQYDTHQMIINILQLITTTQKNIIQNYVIFQQKKKCYMNEDYTSVAGSCSKFKRCSNGYLYILRCPKTLVWDSRWKTCVHKSQAHGHCGKKYSQFNYQQYDTTYKTEKYPSYQYHNEYNINNPVYPTGSSNKYY